MATCTKCDEVLPHDFAVCKGPNNCQLHFGLCAGIQEASWRKMSRSDWKCQECRKIQKSDSGTAVTAEELRNFMASINQKLEPVKEIKSLVTAVNELKHSVEFVTAQYDEMKNIVDAMEKTQDETSNAVNALQREVAEKNAVISSLTTRMRDTEQYARNKNIEISGLEIKKDEDLVGVVARIAQLIGVSFSRDDIDVIHRVPSRSSRADRGPSRVIAQFCSRKKRNEFLKNKNTYGPLLSKDVVAGGNSTERVYLNTHLTPEWKNLLWRTKQVGKPLGYKAIWYQDSHIVAKKDFADNHPVYVKSEGDLSKL